MKNARTYIITILSSAFPIVANAQAATTLQAFANSIASLLNAGAILLITATIVVYFYGIASNVFKIGQGEAKSDFSKYLMSGIIALFLMVSIWGVIRVLQYSLFGGPGPSASNGVVMYH
jgi:hypothetical protein